MLYNRTLNTLDLDSDYSLSGIPGIKPQIILARPISSIRRPLTSVGRQINISNNTSNANANESNMIPKLKEKYKSFRINSASTTYTKTNKVVNKIRPSSVKINNTSNQLSKISNIIIK